MAGKMALITSAVISIVILMVVLSIGYIIFSPESGDPGEVQGEKEILYMEIDGCGIYVDDETLRELDNITALNVSGNRIEIASHLNLSEAMIRAQDYFNDPYFDQDRSRTDQFWFEENSTGKTLCLGGLYAESLNVPGTSPESLNRISDGDLEMIAEDVIMAYRGEMWDLRLDHISASRSYVGNSETGEKFFLGYGDYIVVYKQYLGGVMVSGSRGEVKVSLSSQGQLQMYRDDSVKLKEIIDEERAISTPQEAISDYVRSRGSTRDYGLDEIHLVYELYDRSTIGVMSYELHIVTRSEIIWGEVIYIRV